MTAKAPFLLSRLMVTTAASGVLTAKKAAVEIGNGYTNANYKLVADNTTVNGYEINDEGINTNSTMWGNKNSMGTDALDVIIDGVDVY